MAQNIVAGVDWAGGEWLAVIFKAGAYTDYILSEGFEELWEHTPNHDQMFTDVPIGLPDDDESLSTREELDSLARSVTGRPSSVFPAPSRGACKLANEGAEYGKVAAKNEEELEKGLNKQSYYIASGIGEVDAFLRSNDTVSESVIESHPEVCFRGLLGRQLQHSKNTAAGTGERLKALGIHLDAPGTVLEEISGDLIGETGDVQINDVIDALGLAVAAWMSLQNPRYLPKNWSRDSEEFPMRMAYWSDEPLY